MNATIPQQVLRGDLLQLALGVIVLATGLAACFLFIPRARRRDYTLLFFGLAAVLYGIRLLVTPQTSRFVAGSSKTVLAYIDVIITGVITVPLGLFFAEIVPRWKRLVYVIVALQLAEGIFYIASQLSDRAAELSTRINGITVLVTIPFLILLFITPEKGDRNLWVVRIGFVVFTGFVIYTNLVTIKLIAGNPGIEYLGFVFLLCCLGYVAASQALHKEEKLTAINRELEIARQIQSGLLPGQNAAIPGLQIATKYVPVSSVAGDFYDFLQTDGKGLGVLIADVTGHGVPAALSASMVKIAIRSQADRAHRPAEVLAGLNSVLYGNVHGQFVTAGYVYLDVEKRMLSYSGAGHPPLLLWRAREKRVVSIEENGLFLGAFPGCEYTVATSAFHPGDRVLLYTDGILEAPNPQGEEFGAERLKDFAATHCKLPTNEFCDLLLATIEKWSSRSAAGEQHDDLTLVAVDYAL
ncbi:MAG TPA: SpoIIE family protein phosphatase [Terriglobales bacterium]|nr:SpoIIE family protein phosphatase [Terriglobales bacterium]